MATRTIRPRKLSYADLAAAHATTEREASVSRLTLQAVVFDKPVCVQRYKRDDWRCTIKLYHPTKAHGGLLLIIGEMDGQTPYVSAYYLDDALAEHRDRSRYSFDEAESLAYNTIRIARDAAFSSPAEVAS